MSNEPRYTAVGLSVYDTHDHTVIVECAVAPRALCDLLNAGEQARALVAAVKALGGEDGPYTLTNVGSGVWHVSVDDGFAEEWGCPLADALIELAKKTTMMEGGAQ